MPNSRKKPEDSLKDITNEVTGKLKIYLGASPGVGKTYAMLHDAYESRKKNLDVVIGIVESHGREKIKEMIKKISILPRQKISYQNQEYLEFDLDAALARAPGLILVDEMAHTNIPGLRHEKRWQDIKELLDRGIDVWTTLNVQHIESLKDDVSQIIKVAIHETVPDSMIDLAEKLELVDLAVDDLLKRLHDGKIYIPEQLEAASQNFFQKGNLTALRELALRVTAMQVESEVQSYRKASGVSDIWATREKILVCINSHPESLKIIRSAKRMASSSQAEWVAVYVDTPTLYSFQQKRNNAIYNLRMAQQLGAETHVLTGSNIGKEILHFARVNNVTQIIIWKNTSKKLSNFFKWHLADYILAKSKEINVSIITGTQGHPQPTLKTKKTKPKLKYYLLAIVITTLTTVINWILSPIIDQGSIILLYILNIVSIASLGYIGPAIFASIAAVICYDYIFLQPIYSYSIYSYQHILTLCIMLLVSNIINYLTLTKHNEAVLANKVHHQAKHISAFGRQLLSTYAVDELINLGKNYFSKIFNAQTSVFLAQNKTLQLIDNPKDQSVAQWVYEAGKPAGLGTDTLSSNNSIFLPMIASNKTIGTIKLTPKNNSLFSPEQMILLESCIYQLTMAIEVSKINESTYKKQLATKIDSTKTTILKTIAQHLNKPIYLIINSINQSFKTNIPIDVVLITQEISKISLLNNNMLQIAGLESKSFSLNIKQTQLNDLINLSIESLKKRAKNKAVIFNAPDKAIYINVDYKLLKKVFDNLLDNANKFSLKDSSINISVEVKKGEILIKIENKVENTKSIDVKNLFKKFYKGHNLNIQDGLGIGLTICKIIIEAHHGKIWAKSKKDENIISFNVVLPINT